MAKLLKILLKVIKIALIALGALFVVYFWNLDQKVMEWAYRRVNTIFDRKKADVKF
ncbi:MAG: hypothetical protein J5493_07055 [Lachnospiraceae bacterium]|nr:hypothetical protein [Lachnospiraceae bacterium]